MNKVKGRCQTPSLEENSEAGKDTIKPSFWKADGPKSCKKASRSFKQEISDDILSCCCVNS